MLLPFATKYVMANGRSMIIIINNVYATGLSYYNYIIAMKTKYRNELNAAPDIVIIHLSSIMPNI